MEVFLQYIIVFNIFCLQGPTEGLNCSIGNYINNFPGMYSLRLSYVVSFVEIMAIIRTIVYTLLEAQFFLRGEDDKLYENYFQCF